MSRADAIRDGIEFYDTPYRGVVYKIPCQNCGKIYGSRQYTGKQIYLCSTCRELKNKKEKAMVERMALCIPNVETKEEKRYRTAVERIEKQYGIKGYESAVEICRKATFKYASIPEAMLAIELVKNKYKIIPQQPIGKYRVDFVLPNEKLIIEVDGEPYHTNKEKELRREGEINFTIGLDWHVIHIPSEAITKDVRKVVRLLKKRDTGDNNIV